ncbi:MAG: riboflavin synthase [Candidatus Omnitrophica bacterium]|nr:riboflavin synthase [Candidatus Omnitrophota bacterium]
MFTGIIEELGIVNSFRKVDTCARLSIESAICCVDTEIGNSISVNGCCLTLVDIKKNILIFDISKETLDKSDLSELKAGDKINIERSLKADARLGGHFVTGHVDCRGKIVSKKKKGEFIEIEYEIPKAFMPYLVEKGSIAVDGISLTVNGIREASFTTILIPHTISITTLKSKAAGGSVNIETDILAKYIHKQINRSKVSNDPASSISSNFLKEHGFV